MTPAVLPRAAPYWTRQRGTYRAPRLAHSSHGRNREKHHGTVRVQNSSHYSPQEPLELRSFLLKNRVLICCSFSCQHAEFTSAALSNLLTSYTIVAAGDVRVWCREQLRFQFTCTRTIQHVSRRNRLATLSRGTSVSLVLHFSVPCPSRLA